MRDTVLFQMAFGLTPPGNGQGILKQILAVAQQSDEEIKPQVILSDRRMPHMEGLDLLTRVKERHPGCYCVLMTGYPYIPESVQHALQKGNIDLFIKKPIDNEALLSKIREVFEDRQ